MRSKSDATRWVEKARKFYKSSGKRISFAEFTNPNGAFIEDEMYIFVLNCGGTMLAHGVNEKFVGEEFIDLMDSEGKFFIREIVDTANSKGNGWVDYKWFEPITRKWLNKTVYFEKVDDVIICSGFYDHRPAILERMRAV
ncbi:MAG: cache domain-containing protein [Syntrophobacteraceae bacterium]